VEITNVRRLWLVVAAALVLFLAASLNVFTARPAQASSPCASGVGCFWSNANYSGTLETVLGSWSPRCYNFQYVNNTVSSLWNSTGHTMHVYQGANCTGSYQTYNSGWGTSNLQYTGYNDTFSSVHY
jgi:hypothetical protein